MRTLRTTIVLGVFGLGIYKAWNLVKPKLPAIQARIDEARNRVEPALREATTTARSASKEAAESVRDASLTTAEAAESVANAVGATDSV